MSGDTPTAELLEGFVDSLRTLAKDAPSREVAQAYTWVVESYGDDVAQLRAEVERLTDNYARQLQRDADHIARLEDALGSEHALSGSGDYEPGGTPTGATPRKNVDEFFGTMSSDETDEEFLASLDAGTRVKAEPVECVCGPGAWRTNDAGNCIACDLPIDAGDQ